LSSERFVCLVCIQLYRTMRVPGEVPGEVQVWARTGMRRISPKNRQEYYMCLPHCGARCKRRFGSRLKGDRRLARSDWKRKQKHRHRHSLKLGPVKAKGRGNQQRSQRVKLNRKEQTRRRRNLMVQKETRAQVRARSRARPGRRAHQRTRCHLRKREPLSYGIC